MIVIVKSLTRVQLFVILWTVGHQAPPSMGFPRQEYWSGLPFSSPGDLPDPGIKPGSPSLQVDALTSEPPGVPMGRLKQLLIREGRGFETREKQLRAALGQDSVSPSMGTHNSIFELFYRH